MTQMIKSRILNIDNLERKVFFALLAFLLLFSSLYIHWVRKTVLHVVERDRIYTEMSSLTSRVGDLESKYISLTSGITLELAVANGFKETTETRYISKHALTKKLSLNNEI